MEPAISDQLDRNTSTSQKSGRLEALHLLYKNNILGLGVTQIVALILVFGFEHPNDMTQRLIWLCAMTAILAVRLTDYFCYVTARKRSQADLYSRFIKRFSFNLVLTALAWSVYGIWFHETATFVSNISTVVILAAFAGGSVNFLSSNRILAVTYSTLVLLPYSVVLIFSAASGFHMFGWLGAFFTFVMCGSAFNASHFTKQAIAHKYQNQHLISHMEKEIEDRTKQLDRLSRFDSLTNLLNRYGFLKALKRVQIENEHYSLMFMDLDGFKSINDRLGHAVGDDLLQQAAARLMSSLNERDLVGRWGGDEFLVLTLDREGLEQKANGLIEDISRPYVINRMNLSIGVTIGVAHYPEHGRSYDLLIQNADIAMYQQKKAEKGQVGFFSQAMYEKYTRELTLKDQLEDAILNNHLELYYQPIFDARTKEVVSFEALCRWQLDGEFIPPDEFIVIAEQHGLIQSLGNWVLKRACEDSVSLSQMYPSAAIGINVSVIQFQDDEFVELIEVVLAEVGVSSANIHLELTESVFATDKGGLLKRIERVREMGIKVSLDDFGTGYSSLSVIQDIGVDVIKIDRAFINNIFKNGSAIIGAVAHMSQSMGQGVVAEGVETQEQADQLIANGIYHHQGFLYNKPMPLSELMARHC
ncbi:putative bifunctional diguanylate cyclase/phosphodiesterase [Marinomonas mediterranea]|uniref:Diguanylate cyclase/phosphodiesterase n=1 Tax=Marinomonas mediterranea (strain ATCC 700492 / JCM 21426 / NBRC 103028 / MMB-1) TaxID=717774 RepID=F2JYK0_MARM1|nr:EAL domain-containing protein [Marinomonas mediterranea]ADZ93129.1 diguanylate cyclase/phosphodiesterase [Marinomonas mediterranea MMB-1]WCN11037.1 EAL domain-containing protein [Marinomonas mediterranea]WCN15095.1 EAL domain-containing protein [Marinomonas mediterranea]WCN19138.1 EAL domain-containing protein [Marinomonas mediterranea MMB-1]